MKIRRFVSIAIVNIERVSFLRLCNIRKQQYQALRSQKTRRFGFSKVPLAYRILLPVSICCYERYHYLFSWMHLDLIILLKVKVAGFPLWRKRRPIFKNLLAFQLVTRLRSYGRNLSSKTKAFYKCILTGDVHDLKLNHSATLWHGTADRLFRIIREKRTCVRKKK